MRHLACELKSRLRAPRSLLLIVSITVPAIGCGDRSATTPSELVSSDDVGGMSHESSALSNGLEVIVSTAASLGPAQLNQGNQEGVGRAGKTHQVAVHPTNSNEWLAATMGGLFRTTDAGQSWVPLTEVAPATNTASVAYATANPQVIYAGTGLAAFDDYAFGNGRTNFAGSGILKSTNAGSTWQLLGAAELTGLAVSEVRVDPANSANVMVGATRARPGTHLEPIAARPTGVFKSTDGGATWSRTLSGQATELVIDPGNFNRQLAGLGEPYDNFDTSANGVYRSADGGTTWSSLAGPWQTNPHGVGRVQMSISPSNANVVYVGIQNRWESDCIFRDGTVVDPTDPGYQDCKWDEMDGFVLGIWRTTNAWDPEPTWEVVIVNDHLSDTPENNTLEHLYDICAWECASNWDMAVDPTNSNVLFNNGVANTRYDHTLARWWHVFSDGPAYLFRWENNHIVFAGDRMINVGDVGLLAIDGTLDASNFDVAPDVTVGDLEISVVTGNLVNQRALTGALLAGEAHKPFASFQDSGVAKGESPAHLAWERIPSVLFTKLDWARATSTTRVVGRTEGNGLGRYTGVLADPYIPSLDATSLGIDPEGSIPDGAIAVCPSIAEVVLFGTDNVWRSNDFFTAATPTFVSNGGELDSAISAIAFADSDSTCATYAVATIGGKVHVTTNAGASWSEKTSTLPAQWPTALAFSPVSSSRLYVSFSAIGSNLLFVTENATAAAPTWQNISTPDTTSHNEVAITRLPGLDQDVIFVGTQLGGWVSSNKGILWTSLTTFGLPHTRIVDIHFAPPSGQTVDAVVFTHGRGAFRLKLTANPCVARTCDSAAAHCGVIDNQCGGTVDCGACAREEVYRLLFYKNNAWFDHFYTSSEAGRDAALRNGYGYEGIAGHVYPSARAGTVPLHELYLSWGKGQDRLYTTSTAEKDSLLNSGWQYFGVVGWVVPAQANCPAGTSQLHRLYHPRFVDHFYTASWPEAVNASQNGWRYEGVQACIFNTKYN